MIHRLPYGQDRADTEPVDSGVIGMEGVRNGWYDYPEREKHLGMEDSRRHEPDYSRDGLSLDRFDLQMAIRHKRQLRVAPLLAGMFVLRRTPRSMVKMVF